MAAAESVRTLHFSQMNDMISKEYGNAVFLGRCFTETAYQSVLILLRLWNGEGMRMKLSVVVPCYNEQEALPYFIREINAVAEQMHRDCGLEFEFLFVDDGSADQTLSVLREAAQQDDRIRYLSFSRNFGKEAALFAGMKHAVGDFVVTMDADMQDPPSLLPQMYAYLQTGEYDSVATRRVNRKGEPPIRSFLARCFYVLINKISDADIVDGARDYRLMTRKFVNALLSMSEYNRFSKGMFGWVGFRTKWLEFENVERIAGETKWSFWKLFKYALEGIVAFSTAPLVLSSFLGLLCCGVAFFFVAFVVIRKLIFGDPVSGWASTVSIMLFIGGIQMLCIGILGQYLAKTYMEVKNRPIFLVAETNCGDQEKPLF